MNLRHLKLWKRHHAAAAASSDVGGETTGTTTGKSRDVVDVVSPGSDSGYSDVAPTFSSMFGRAQPTHHGGGGHLLVGHRAGAGDQRDRGRNTAAAVESSGGRRRADATGGGGGGPFRGLRGSSTPRSAADSTRRTLSPPSADVKSPTMTSHSDVHHDVKSPTVPKATTSAGGATVEAFFTVVRQGNVDKLRQFIRDSKFDVNARDSVRHAFRVQAYIYRRF